MRGACARRGGNFARGRTRSFVERVNDNATKHERVVAIRRKRESTNREREREKRVNENARDERVKTRSENARNVSTRTREEHVNKNERANEIDGSSKIHPASYSVPYSVLTTEYCTNEPQRLQLIGMHRTKPAVAKRLCADVGVHAVDTAAFPLAVMPLHRTTLCSAARLRASYHEVAFSAPRQPRSWPRRQSRSSTASARQRAGRSAAQRTPLPRLHAVAHACGLRARVHEVLRQGLRRFAGASASAACSASWAFPSSASRSARLSRRWNARARVQSAASRSAARSCPLRRACRRCESEASSACGCASLRSSS